MIKTLRILLLVNLVFTAIVLFSGEQRWLIRVIDFTVIAAITWGSWHMDRAARLIDKADAALQKKKK